MSVNVTLTHIPNAGEKTTRLNLEQLTSLEVYNYMHSIRYYNPQDNIIRYYNPQDDNGNNYLCGFNIYYKSVAFRVVPYDIPKKWHDKKNDENELVIEMIPLSKSECGSQANYHCPICLANGECKSPFIKKYIGKVLFPEKYGKQR